MTAQTIVIDALSVHMGGGLSFLARQVTAIRAAAPDRRLVVLTAPWNHTDLATIDGIEPRSVGVRGLLGRLAYEQLVLPRAAAAGDVLYCPGNLVPLAPMGTPSVMTLQNPNMVGAGRVAAHNRGVRRRVQAALTRVSLRRADRVVVISESLREQLIGDDILEPERVVVVPSGAPDLPPPESDVAPDGFPVAPGEYLLVLANDAPHKRHDDMIRAWASAFGTDDPTASDAPALVIAGRMREERRAAQRALVPVRLRSQLVHLGGVVDRREVSWLLRHARALVAMASLEAHPLTPAEAGRTGCPLVLSDIPAHREVAGDHAQYVPIGDVDRLAQVLRSLPRATRRDEWCWPVTWEENARRMLAVFDEVTR